LTLPVKYFTAKKDKINVYNKQCMTCTAKRKKEIENRKCPHGREKMICPNCDGPNICCHKKLFKYCLVCDGHAMCVHDKIKSKCKECDIKAFLKNIIMGRMNDAIKNSPFTHLGCSMDEFMIYIENQFKEDMNFNNFGDVWHLTYRLPIGLGSLEKDEIINRFHYTNIYPAYPYTNRKKKTSTHN